MSTLKKKLRGVANKLIGTRKESSLHRTLKYHYTGAGGKTEVESKGFVADGISKTGEYVEVQTSSFAPLIKKVKEFSSNGKVRIIHPIAVNKIIEVYKPASSMKEKKSLLQRATAIRNKKTAQPYGKLLYCRKSPHKGSLWEIFKVLIHAPLLPLEKNIIIEVVLADITEKRIKDGKGSWRRKGISIFDRELSLLRESIIFKKPSDFLRFIPFKRNEEFTSAMLAQRMGIDRKTAGKALYVLSRINVVKKKGKKKNFWIYEPVPKTKV